MTIQENDNKNSNTRLDLLQNIGKMTGEQVRKLYRKLQAKRKVAQDKLEWRTTQPKNGEEGKHYPIDTEKLEKMSKSTNKKQAFQEAVESGFEKLGKQGSSPENAKEAHKKALADLKEKVPYEKLKYKMEIKRLGHLVDYDGVTISKEKLNDYVNYLKQTFNPNKVAGGTKEYRDALYYCLKYAKEADYFTESYKQQLVPALQKLYTKSCNNYRVHHTISKDKLKEYAKKLKEKKKKTAEVTPPPTEEPIGETKTEEPIKEEEPIIPPQAEQPKTEQPQPQPQQQPKTKQTTSAKQSVVTSNPTPQNAYKLAKDGRLFTSQHFVRPKSTFPTLSRFDAHHDKQLQKLISKYNITKEQYKAFTNEITRIIDNSNICIAVKHSLIIPILRTGYKTLLQTKKSGGCEHPEARIEIEKKIFDSPITDETSPNSARYGFIGSKNAKTLRDEAPTFYGDAILTLKRDRFEDVTTFTLGDSLNHYYVGMARGFPMSPSLVSNPTISSLISMIRRDIDYNGFNDSDKKDFLTKLKQINDGASFMNKMGDYIEAQIHRPITAEDIESINLREGAYYDPELINEIKKHGIKIIYA